MDNWLERTELLLGKEKLDLLRQAHVLVVGLGGVGAYAAEMVARAGVGRMTIADADAVAHAVASALRPSDELLTVITGRNAGRDVGALAASAVGNVWAWARASWPRPTMIRPQVSTLREP